MRSIFQVTSVVCGLLVATAANAADPPIVRKAPAAAPASFSWTGCYVGGYAGGAWGNNVSAIEPSAISSVGFGGPFTAPPGTFYSALAPTPGGAFGTVPNGGAYRYSPGSSAIAGGTVGCNYQVGNYVFGVEGEAGSIHLSRTVTDPFSVPLAGGDTRDSTRIGNGYGLIAGRVGYAWDRWMLYVKGGGGFVDVNRASWTTATWRPAAPTR